MFRICSQRPLLKGALSFISSSSSSSSSLCQPSLLRHSQVAHFSKRMDREKAKQASVSAMRTEKKTKGKLLMEEAMEDDDYDEEDDAMEGMEHFAEILAMGNEKYGGAFDHDMIPAEAVIQPKAPSHEMRHKNDSTGLVYTENSNVNTHTQAEVGQYYDLGEDISKIPQSLFSASLQEEMKHTINYFMIRQEAFNFCERLRKEPETMKGQKFGLKGRAGTGKSGFLNYVAQNGLSAGYLVLGTGAEEFMYEKLGFIQPSSEDVFGPDIWDQPRYTTEWCKNMINSQSEVLESIKLKNDYHIEETVITEGLEKLREYDPKNMLELLQIGVGSFGLSPKVLSIFHKEARLVTETTVVVIVDSYNMWDEASEFYDFDAVSIKPRKLALAHMHDDLLMNPSDNMVTLMSHTSHNNLRNMQTHLNNMDEELEILKYTSQELCTVFYHYRLSNFLGTPHDNMTDAFMGRAKQLTGGNPKEVLAYAFFV